MGKRVHIRLTPLMALGPVDIDGSLVVAPGPQTAMLSCGHGKPFRVSFFASSGDPAWCDECEGTCRACGAPATTCVDNTLDWGEACDKCVAEPIKTWPARVAAQRFRAQSRDEHIDCAAHFVAVAKQCEREAATKKHKFWEYPRNHPLWESHTREGRAATAKEMFVESVRHALAALFAENTKPSYRSLGRCVVCGMEATGAAPAVCVDNRRDGPVAHYRCREIGR